MFYAPTTVASMVADTQLSDLYSDLHKDAVGCRPGAAQMAKVKAMSPIEYAVEEARLAEWTAEGERIEQLGYEVARFRFSRSMEYIQRREGVSEKEAFRETVENADRYFFKGSDQNWEYVCYSLGLPYSDAPKLKAFWEEPA